MIFTLIEAALRSLIVAAAVWAGLRALRVSNVVAQKRAWGLVLFSALLMPLLMQWKALPAGMAIVLPAQPWQQQLAPSAEATHSATELQRPALIPSSAKSVVSADLKSTDAAQPVQSDRPPATINSSTETVIPSDLPKTSSASLKPQTTALWSISRIASLAALIYFAIFAGLLLRLIYGLGAAALLWFRAQPVVDPSLALIHRNQAPGVSLRSSRAISSPVTIGSGVLLPACFRRWDAEKLRIVLAHEISHVRQGDFYLQLLAELYAAMFWFSPLGWWLKRKLCDLSETISDRAGLCAAPSAPSYAQVLLEFAAAPRLTMRGVAMARPSNLSRRIERLLNESTFRQAFAGGRRRALLAVLLVPAALFAASALIRVEAASQAAPAPVVAPQPAPELAPQAPEAAISAPLPPAPPAALPVPLPASAPSPIAPPGLAPLAPLPPAPPAAFVFTHPHEMVMAWNSQEGHDHTNGFSYNYSYSSNGDSYGLITGNNERNMISGNWHDMHSDAIEKARKMAHGDFLWFTRDGKSYVVDDPAIVSQIQAMYKPMEELGKKQEELGKQQEALGKQQEELGHKMESATIPTPDMSKEIAELQTQMEKLKTMQGKTMTTEEWAEMQSKLGNLQGKLGAIRGEIGGRQGSFGGEMGKLGAMQGKLGAEQGKLGAEQGRLAQQADRQVRSIIDQSLTNGKARPIE
jgi:beta-lactamase regulating signal transducer with metallopeptidase domain